MYELRSENLTMVGSSMATQRTWTNWRKYFRALDAAQAYALSDLRQVRRDANAVIEWRTERAGLCSGDLLSVEYHIQPLVFEDDA